MLDNEPDVALVLLDLALPGARGLDFLADLKLDYPGVPVVVLSATHDRATVPAALAAGARGFIPKTADARDAARRHRHGARRRRVPAPTTHADARRRRRAHLRPTSSASRARQTDVLQLLVQGKPNKLICRDLQLSEGTVKVHVSAILKALRVHSRTQAIAELARRGISVETLRGAARRDAPERGRATPPMPASPRCPRSRSRARAPTRSPRSTGSGTGRPRRWCSARCILCTRAVGPGSRPGHGGMVRRHPRQPGVARPARARVPARAAAAVADAPRWGRVLGGRLDARRRAVGRGGGRDVSRRRRRTRRC